MARNISQRGIDFIVSFEGKKTLLADGRYAAYLDTLANPPVPTIYCGLTKGVKMGMVLTKEQCDAMFAREVNIYDNAVDELVTVELSQAAHDACCSFVYNCGVGAFKGSTLLKLINQGKMEQAAAQFARWNKAGGKVWPGLVRRRAAEAALFLSPDPLGEAKEIAVRNDDGEVFRVPETEMPQRVEESKPSVTKEVAASPTVWSAVAGLFSAIGAAWQHIGAVATDTTAEVARSRDSLSGFEALWSHVGLSAGSVLLAVTIGALGVVLVRHVQRYAEGRG